jgi:hypothetical protein
MAHYTTSADLLDSVLFRAGEPMDSTSDFYTVALIYLNRAYQAIWSGASELDQNVDNQTWWWLRKSTPGILTLLPVIETGTVLVTNNSTSITFSSAPATSVAGYHFKVNTHADVFRISAHTAAAAGATLDGVYTGTTAAAASYRLMKLEYDLASDAMAPISPFRAYQDSIDEIEIMDLKELERSWSLSTFEAGVPKAFAIVGERLSSTDAMTIRFSHGGGLDGTTDLIRVDYDYFFMPTDLADDTAEPLIPRQYRKILADFALGWLLTDKEDNRAAAAFGAAREGLRAMQRENRRRWTKAGRSMGRIFPRQTHMDRRIAPLRTTSGHIIG